MKLNKETAIKQLIEAGLMESHSITFLKLENKYRVFVSFSDSDLIHEITRYVQIILGYTENTEDNKPFLHISNPRKVTMDLAKEIFDSVFSLVPNEY